MTFALELLLQIDQTFMTRGQIMKRCPAQTSRQNFSSAIDLSFQISIPYSAILMRAAIQLILHTRTW
jgi:hypothetical protein